MIVCVCKNLSESDLRILIRDGFDSVRLLGQKCDLGRQCGRCVPYARGVIREELADKYNECCNS